MHRFIYYPSTNRCRTKPVSICKPLTEPVKSLHVNQTRRVLIYEPVDKPKNNTDIFSTALLNEVNEDTESRIVETWRPFIVPIPILYSF